MQAVFPGHCPLFQEPFQNIIQYERHFLGNGHSKCNAPFLPKAFLVTPIRLEGPPPKLCEQKQRSNPSSPQACHGRFAAGELFFGRRGPSSFRLIRLGSIPFSILVFKICGIEYKLGGKNTRFAARPHSGHPALIRFPSVFRKTSVNFPQS